MNFALNVLGKIIPIPRHIAFIMDGNRRYARKQMMETSKGHLSGFNTLIKILEYCLKSGVKIVTVYAFSLDNFGRTPEEVQFLMNLALEKFSEFNDQSSIIMENEIRIRVIGDMKKFPAEIQDICKKVEIMTSSHDKLLLNICFGYSSTWEIQKAMNNTQEQLESFPKYMEISNPNLLVRTSGENRLSDFLLYQCTQGTQLKFIEKCWPDLSFLDFIKVLLSYRHK
eukprot:NODE_13_length_54415_cov_0.522424.p31 type:complete len:226 gc:universal NODE_13_length_54415_cov_0.522424:44367-45044(+)